MAFFVIVFLGVLQGLTEFLPISSSGHLTLFNLIFPSPENFLFLTVLLHLATMLAVIVCFRKKIWQLIRNPFSKEVGLLILASIPTFVIFLFFGTAIEESFSGNYLATGFSFSAVLLTAAHLFQRKENPMAVTINSPNSANLRWWQALFMGTMQGVALFPGVSRSGTTLATGMLSGANKSQAADFSFLMSIPVIFGSFLHQLVFRFDEISISTGNLPAVLFSFLLAFVVGILSIKFMLRVVKKSKLWMFSVYLVLLSFVTLLLV